MANLADIGLVGLAVMGENLVLNMERNGFSAAVYNRHTDKVDAFLAGRGAGNKKTPRRIILYETRRMTIRNIKF